MVFQTTSGLTVKTEAKSKKVPLANNSNTANMSSNNSGVMLISKYGRSVPEIKRADSGTPVPVVGVRYLTLFHDLEACPMESQVDPFDTMNAVLASLSAAAVHGSALASADTLAREWRLYKSSRGNNAIGSPHGVLSADQVEQFDDLGFSTIIVGRKTDATAAKLKHDLMHFVESHSDPRRHAVVLLVRDQSQFGSEIRRLTRMGFQAFVVTAPPTATSTGHAFGNTLSSTIDSTGCVHIGQWNKIVDRAISASALYTDKQIQQQVHITPASSFSANVDHHQFLVTQPGLDNPQPDFETPSDATTTTTVTVACQKVMPMTPRQTHTVPEVMDDSETESKADIDDRGWVTPPPAPLTNTRKAASASASRTDTEAYAAADPYRIIFGHLELNTNDVDFSGPHERIGFKIAEYNSPQKVHHVSANKVDYNYAWLNLVRQRLPDKWLVCCRLHNSGLVTDVRLCGRVERVVRGSFGFIAHPLFPSNLYFRLTDVDAASSSSTTSNDTQSRKVGDASVDVGDVVAFRVGQKGNRMWALRVWKVPSGVARFISETTTTKASTSFRHPQQKNHRFNGSRPQRNTRLVASDTSIHFRFGSVLNNRGISAKCRGSATLYAGRSKSPRVAKFMSSAEQYHANGTSSNRWSPKH